MRTTSDSLRAEIILVSTYVTIVVSKNKQVIAIAYDFYDGVNRSRTISYPLGHLSVRFLVGDGEFKCKASYCIIRGEAMVSKLVMMQMFGSMKCKMVLLF